MARDQSRPEANDGPVLSCVVCGVDLPRRAGRGRPAIRCDACREQVGHKTTPRPALNPKPCDECRTGFIPRTSQHVVCSETCRRVRLSRQTRERYCESDAYRGRWTRQEAAYLKSRQRI